MTKQTELFWKIATYFCTLPGIIKVSKKKLPWALWALQALPVPQPFSEVAGDPAFTSASNTADSPRAGSAPAHAHALTSWERACSVSRELDRCSPVQDFSVAGLLSSGNYCNLPRFTLLLLAEGSAREICTKTKKPARSNLSIINRMARFFFLVKVFCVRKHCSIEMYSKTSAGCRHLRERRTGRLTHPVTWG